MKKCPTVTECGDRPIFVTTHNCAENTVYGSDDWGDKGLFDLFSQYPNLINFAGHLHYSLLDERSVWQGAFTAFGTQSTSYVELEKGKVNGSVPPDAYMFPMGYLLDFEEESITVRRMNFRLGKEEKPNMSVKIPYAVTKADFISERMKTGIHIYALTRAKATILFTAMRSFTATERGTIISRIFIRVSPLWLIKSNFLFTLRLRECII